MFQVAYFLIEQFHLLFEGVISDLESFSLPMFELYLKAIGAPLMLFFEILQIFPQYLDLIPHLCFLILGVAQGRPQFGLQFRDDIAAFGVFILESVQLFAIALYCGSQWVFYI